MGDIDLEEKFRVPFPLEIIIGQRPLSAQASNSKARDDWKKTIGQYAQEKINAERELYFLDERPLMATIYYFPLAPMIGDIDNIVKPILDGMIQVVYPNDRHIERVVVQKFEPGIAWLFPSPSAALEAAINREKPVLYIRLEDNLAWRNAS